jgi:hypothetical protein
MDLRRGWDDLLAGAEAVIFIDSYGAIRMKPFWVEGAYLNKQGVKKARKMGAYQQTYVEPFAEVVWANTKAEALQYATEKLSGGEWLEEPKVTLKTEEQRMRSLGEPELPLFSMLKLASRKTVKKK